MLPKQFRHFDRITLVDFEFTAPEGENPKPICMVAYEVHKKKWIQLALNKGTKCPLNLDHKTLYVAFYASAEIGCHLSLDWPIPINVLDLYTEFRCLTNGKPVKGRSLVDALVYFGLSSTIPIEKKEMRELAMRGGVYSEKEMYDLIQYCKSDVTALIHLLTKMAPIIDLNFALLRGLYMTCCARMERNGIPIDVSLLTKLNKNWDQIKLELVKRVDTAFGVYEGTRFKEKKFQKYLLEKGINWPRTPSKKLSLSDDTFKDIVLRYPELQPLRELRSTLGKMRLASLTVGQDGRNRNLLSAFSSKTSRNQPSNTKLIYGPSVWMRSLIKPSKGNALAYIDWSQQEFGIAAALSNDENMKLAYLSGDPYLTFGIQAGAIPRTGTKQSHKAERELFKQCALAVQYGMGARSLGQRIGKDPSYGQELLNLHRKTYPKFWRWNDAAVTSAQVRKEIKSVYGWKLNVNHTTNARTLANFPMQANGAEMLRLAIIFAIEMGVKVCVPVHDAILIESRTTDLERDIALTQEAMLKASKHILEDFGLRTDVERVKYPDRYSDDRGKAIWENVVEIVNELQS